MPRKPYRVIGDVHGKFGPYKKIAGGAERSIVCGDMGVGFKTHDQNGDLVWATNPPHDFMVRNQGLYLRGNHDNPDVCARDAKCIKDGTVWDDVMFIGGAVSIDRAYRTPGISWWENEECSTAELNRFVDIYDMVRPRIMICHECPESIAETMMADFNRTKLDFPSRTRQALQSMVEIHSPEYFLFGHWHVNWSKKVNGTTFICLNELSYIDIEM